MGPGIVANFNMLCGGVFISYAHEIREIPATASRLVLEAGARDDYESPVQKCNLFSPSFIYFGIPYQVRVSAQIGT